MNIPPIFTWNRWPDECPPPNGLDVTDMVQARRTFDSVGVLHGTELISRAIGEANDYADTLIARTGDRAPRKTVLLMTGFADRLDKDGDGPEIEQAITDPDLWPYWAVAGDVIARRLADHYRDANPRAIILHCEAGKRDREQRDLRIEAAIGGQLKRWLPDTLVTGYGIHHAPSIVPSMTAYGSMQEVSEVYDGLSYSRPGEGIAAWMPRAGYDRRSPDYREDDDADATVRAIDVAGYLWAAVQNKADAVILWGGETSSTPEAWTETWRGLGVMA